MKIILQKVDEAEVFLKNEKIVESKNGFVIYVGFGKDDTEEKIETAVSDLLNIKIYDNYTKTVVQKNYDILILSQFTLFAKFKKSKPDFHHAETPDKAKALFDETVKLFRSKYLPSKVKSGIFGAELLIKKQSKDISPFVFEFY